MIWFNSTLLHDFLIQRVLDLKNAEIQAVIQAKDTVIQAKDAVIQAKDAEIEKIKKAGIAEIENLKKQLEEEKMKNK